MDRLKRFAAILCLFALMLQGICVMPIEVMAEESVGVIYTTYEKNTGWMEPQSVSGTTSGNIDQNSPIEAMKLTLENNNLGGGICYQSNVAGKNWMKWMENGNTSGTIGLGSPVEAVRIDLNGGVAGMYDVCYRVYQSGVWSNWVKNGETAGVNGQGQPIIALQVTLIPEGAALPIGDSTQPKAVPEPEVVPEPETLAEPVAPQPENWTASNSIDPSKPMVALTFDDGPYSPVTNRILDCLEANNAKATFFVVGNRVNTYKDTMRRIASLGYEIGNHTFEHRTLTKLSDADIGYQLNATNEAVRSVTGVTPVLMRPTGGAYNQRVLQTIGMPAIMWSIDTLDWKTRNTQSTIDAVLNNIKDGDIVLMHDIHKPTGGAAEAIIPELVRRGYQLVTVSELATHRGGMAAGGVYNKFRP